MPPKALEHLSDEALRRLAQMFEVFEQHLRLPPDRLHSETVRLPETDGGHRLIVLSHALIRVWAKARRWLSAEWKRLHNCDEMWGIRGSHTSTASAFAHNLEQE
eukprot:1169481-Pyramimonas_sp.AAC.1